MLVEVSFYFFVYRMFFSIGVSFAYFILFCLVGMIIGFRIIVVGLEFLSF